MRQQITFLSDIHHHQYFPLLSNHLFPNFVQLNQGRCCVDPPEHRGGGPEDDQDWEDEAQAEHEEVVAEVCPMSPGRSTANTRPYSIETRPECPIVMNDCFFNVFNDK